MTIWHRLFYLSQDPWHPATRLKHPHGQGGCDLSQRLRGQHDGTVPIPEILHEAADAIDTLEAEAELARNSSDLRLRQQIDALVKALEEISELYAGYPHHRAKAIARAALATHRSGK